MIFSVLVVFTMGHHPSGGHGQGGLTQWVHGAMIVFLALLFYGFCRFCQIHDVRRPNVLFGLIAYGIGLFAHVVAATINGFVVGALAARGDVVGHEIFLLCWELNQAAARLGVVATGTAMVAWSLDFVRQSSWFDRGIGSLGILGGIAPVVWLLGVAPEMNVAVALAIYTSHMLWVFLVGIRLWRGVD